MLYGVTDPWWTSTSRLGGREPSGAPDPFLELSSIMTWV